MTAYFVRDVEVLDPVRLWDSTDVEINIDESLDVAKRRLQYKIKRGEYDFSAAVYAKKVLDCFGSGKRAVPQKLVDRWVSDVVSPLIEKTKENFAEKFSLEKLTRNLPDCEKRSFSQEINGYLLNDLERRAKAESLLELPKFVMNAIEECDAEKQTYESKQVKVDL